MRRMICRPSLACQILQVTAKSEPYLCKIIISTAVRVRMGCLPGEQGHMNFRKGWNVESADAALKVGRM